MLMVESVEFQWIFLSLMGPRGRPGRAGAEDAQRAPGGGFQGRGGAQGERRWRPGREKTMGQGRSVPSGNLT